MSGIEKFNIIQALTDKCFNIGNHGPVQNLLKCGYCNKFLSVGPIFGQEDEMICGRCRFIDFEDPKWTRQILYESLAMYLIFPCSNVNYGCKDLIKWGEVEEHENICLYRKTYCPFSNKDICISEKCHWGGARPELEDHLEICHGNIINKLSEINFSSSKCDMMFLTRIFKQLMIVMVKYEDADKYSCMIVVNGIKTDANSFRYQLELYDENRNNTVILRRNRLEDVADFGENINKPDKMLLFDLSIIKEMLHNPNIIRGRFGVIRKHKSDWKGEDKESNASKPSTIFDDNFLKELECPVCKNYMMPPIHMCKSGHSVCSKCRVQLTNCPSCRSPIYDSRNYSLEKLTAFFNYPCMYKEAGCKMICSSEELHDHEKNCCFSGIHCFLNCSTSVFILDMLTHLKEKHREHLLTPGDLYILDFREALHGENETVKHLAMYLGNDIFRLTIKYGAGQTKFALHQFGVHDRNYMYEVEIICATQCSEKFIVTKEIAPLTSSLFLNCISVPENMIQHYLSEDNLIFFKINLKNLN